MTATYVVGDGAPARGSRHRGERVAAMVSELKGPLDVLILQGQALVERLRCLPFRRVAALGDSAEQVLLAVVKLDALLGEVALAASGDPPQADDDMPDLEPCELPSLIEIVVGDAIDEVGANPKHVDLRVSPLSNGWARISIEDTGRGRPGAIDFPRLFATTKRAIGSLGLIVAGEIVTEHGGRLLVRPMSRGRASLSGVSRANGTR